MKGKPMIPISNCRGRVAMPLTAFATLALLLLSSAVVCAQTTISTGSIVGTVTDPQGALVAGAKVTITDKTTGQVITI
jgi:hypothetical protein